MSNNESKKSAPVRMLSDIVIGEDGKINGFPGFEHPELVRHYLDEVSDSPYVSFYSGFDETKDGRTIMIWMIQPDGRYWEDEDGFGGTGSIEVQLYAYIDEKGKFLSKFRIYSLGRDKYFGTDLEEQSYRKLMERSGKG